MNGLTENDEKIKDRTVFIAYTIAVVSFRDLQFQREWFYDYTYLRL